MSARSKTGRAKLKMIFHLVFLLSLCDVAQSENRFRTEKNPSVAGKLNSPPSRSRAKDKMDRASSPLSFQSENKQLEKQLNKSFKNQAPNRKDISNYLIKKNYFKSKIIKGNRWTIKNPVKTVFVFKGNRFLRSYDIKKIIKIDEPRPGADLRNTVIRSLLEAYRKNGFQKVKISHHIKTKKWEEKIYLKIKEGPRIRIDSMKITGFLSNPPRTYIDFIKNNSTDLIKKGYYNKKDLETGYKNLIKHLRGRGYLQSRLYPDRVVHKGKSVEITVNLEEGPLTLIKNINLEGNKNIPSREILSGIQSGIQSPLRLKVLEKDLDFIEALYKKKGYLNVKTQRKNIVKFEQKNQYVTLHLIITEGPRTFVSDIQIEGTAQVEEDLVTDLLQFKEGDVLTPEKINLSINALSSSGLFSRIAIEPAEENSSVIRVSVREKKSQDIRGGLGINTKRNLTGRAYGEYRHKNLFGRGRSFFGTISGQRNLIRLALPLEYEIAGIYKEIFVPGKGFTGLIGVSRSHNIFSYFTKEVNAVKKNQINFSVDKKFTRHLKAGFKLWDFESRRETCVNNPNCPTNLQRIGSSSISLKYDKREGVFNPTKGGVLSAKAEYGSPAIGSSLDIQFLKLDLSNQLYHSISDYIFAVGLGGGILFSNRSIPASRSFILGGQSSLRGYDGEIEGERLPSAQIAPIQKANDPLQLKWGESLQPVSFSRYALIKLELRFPIMENIRGLVFYDAGFVHLSTEDNSAMDYGHSAGLGFRYETLFVPIGLDIAYKLPPRPTAKSNFDFHVAIGLF